MALTDQQMMMGMFGQPVEPEESMVPFPYEQNQDALNAAVGLPDEAPELPALPAEYTQPALPPPPDAVSSADAGPLPLEMANLGRKPVAPPPQRSVADVTTPGLDGNRERLLEAYNLHKNANQEAYEAESQKRAFEAEKAQAVAALDQEEEMAQQRLDEAARQSAAEFRAQYERQMEQANRSTDSTRFWHNKGNAHKAAGFISAFLGAFQGPDMMQNVNSIIDQAVQRDIQDQQSEIAAERQKLADMGQLRAMDIDQEQASRGQLTREFLVRKKGLIAELAKRAAQLDDGVAKANMQQATAAAEAGLANDLNNLEGAEYNRKRTELQQDRQYKLQKSANAQGWARIKDARAARAEAARLRELELKAKQDEAKAMFGPDAVVDPDTGELIGYHRMGDKGAEKVQETVINYRDLRSKLEQYEAAYRKAGRIYKGFGGKSRWADSQQAQELRQLHTDLASAATKAASGAGASDEEFKRMMDIIPAPPSLTEGADIGPAIKRYQDWQDAKVDRQIRGFINGPDGRPVRFSASDLYQPVGGQEEGQVLNDDLGQEAQSAVSDVKKSDWWVRGADSTKSSTERFADLHDISVRAENGDGDAMGILKQIASDESLPTSKAAQSLLAEVETKRAALAADPNILSVDEKGRPIAEKMLGQGGERQGTRYFKDGVVAYETEFWPGTEVPKSSTFYRRGKPASRVIYNESGAFVKKEKL